MIKDHYDLFENNKNLVGWVFKKHFSQYRSFEEDLMQEGFLGLWKACISFDPNRSIKFSTYAVVGIRFAMKNYKEKFICKSERTMSIDCSFDECEDFGFLNILHSDPEDLSTIHLLERAMLQMAEKRSVVEKSLEGFTQKEISKQANISQTQVCRILHKFKKIFIEELRKENG